MRFGIKATVVAGAAAAALAVGIMPANAAFTTFTVKAGNAAAGSKVGVTGATTGASPQVTFQDTTKGTTLHCNSAGATGTVLPGNYPNGSIMGQINGPATTWNTCTGPLGLVLVPVGSNIWKIRQTGTNAATGVSNGRIESVVATVSSTDGTSCKFTVKGNVPISYDNATGNLAVNTSTANLVVSAVTGCFGLITNGDHANFSATYHLTANLARYNPITITAP